MKKILLIIEIFVIILLFIYIVLKINFYINFVRIKSINIVSLETELCNFVIPVKYIDNKRSELHGKAIYTPEKKRYSLRYSDTENKLFITINQMAWCGLTVFRARYEITDENTHKKLLELYKK